MPKADHPAVFCAFGFYTLNFRIQFRRMALAWSLFLLPALILGQTNLIPNPGFEKYIGKGLFVPAAKPWKNIYTADYYRGPFKLSGDKKVDPHGGKCFVGLRFQLNYREYLEVRLDSNLKAGHKYKVEFWICFGEWSTYASKSLGVCFSKKQLNQQQVEQLPKEFKVQVTNKKGIIDDYQWTKLTMTYTAIGGERYITIGNMADKLNKDFKRIKKPFSKHEIYYFMDDFAMYDDRQADTVHTAKLDSMILAEKSLPIDSFKTASAKDMKVGQIIKLHNVFFEPDRADLLEESYDELDYIVAFLKENPFLELQVNGHTDNSGYDLNNQTLSEQRAYTVYNYLLRKGVKNNLKYKGFGATRPIASNASAAGRARNRRVELEITKKD